MFQLWINQVVGFYYQNVTLPQVFFKHFGSKNQLPGFQISRTLVENELTLHNIIYLMNKIIWHHLSQYLGLPYYEEGDLMFSKIPT